MFFRPTFEEFSKAARAKKIQIEELRIAAENNHKSALNQLSNAFLTFASQMLPYFEETCVISCQDYLYLTFDNNLWCYKITYYPDHRIECILEYENKHHIILDYQDGATEIKEVLTTGDDDINCATNHFQSSVFMGDIANELLECIQ